MLNNEYYFQVPISEEQEKFANKLVDFSINHHKVPNVWDGNITKPEQTREYRLTGTLGEIIFADAYSLERPTKSFGAIDGQDYGKDFQIEFNGNIINVDTKTMHRKKGVFYSNYVLNIPSSQLHRKDSITDYYFCISIHQENDCKFASFLGLIKKSDVINGIIGKLYTAGTVRIRADKTTFEFFQDTYEIDFKDIISPPLTKRIKEIEGYQKLKLK
ncbi:MAG: hypothetical protein ACOX1V_02000 [Candidatus Iainarchaeum sp.]